MRNLTSFVIESQISACQEARLRRTAAIIKDQSRSCVSQVGTSGRYECSRHLVPCENSKIYFTAGGQLIAKCEIREMWSCPWLEIFASTVQFRGR